jgi:autotransporter-associated beta strand protein
MGGLTKLGAGTLELTGANMYAGDTKVASGALNIDQASLKDTIDVYLAAGSSLGLNYAGTDVIDSLFIGGVSQTPGTYGGIGSGANFERPFFSGPGLLQVGALGIAGDYNDDGIVNAGDYVLWRKTDGSPFGYGLWQANFGRALGAGAGSSVSASGTFTPAIPEPASTLLFIMGWGTIVVPGFRRRREAADFDQVGGSAAMKSRSEM